MKLKGKNILITGGGSGYGKGIASVLVKAGANVWITGRNAEKLRDSASTIGAKAVVADVSCPEDWDKVLAAMDNKIDVLVNNAGCGGHLVPTMEQTPAEISATIATNLTGAIIGCSKAAKLMCAQKSGAIINVSSVCALYAWPGWSVYTAAKAGLAKFSHGLYTEVRPFGVRVTCLTPSWGRTDFNVNAHIQGASESLELAAKCTTPEELGNLVREILETPDHLAIPDVTLQPMVQDICPM